MSSLTSILERAAQIKDSGVQVYDEGIFAVTFGGIEYALGLQYVIHQAALTHLMQNELIERGEELYQASRQSPLPTEQQAELDTLTAFLDLTRWSTYDLEIWEAWLAWVEAKSLKEGTP